VVRYWRGYLSEVFAYGPADAAATPSSLASVKSRMVYLSGTSLPGCPGIKGRETDVVVVVVVVLLRLVKSAVKIPEVVICHQAYKP